MSLQRKTHRITVADIINRKGGDPIVSLTSYHAHTAAIVDKYAVLILVGDSLGMVTYGMDSTISVTLDLMISHGKALFSRTQMDLIVVDIPFELVYWRACIAFDTLFLAPIKTICLP